MYTAPPREHGFRGLSTLHSCDIFMIFLLLSMVSLALFWDRFWKPFWLVLGSTFGALSHQKVTKMSSKIDVGIDIEKSRFRGCLGTKEILEQVARRGVRG